MQSGFLSSYTGELLHFPLRRHHTQFTDEETEGQKGEVTLPVSFSLKGRGMI